MLLFTDYAISSNKLMKYHSIRANIILRTILQHLNDLISIMEKRRVGSLKAPIILVDYFEN